MNCFTGAIKSKLLLSNSLILSPFGVKEKIKFMIIKDKKTPVLISMSCIKVFPFLKGALMSSIKLATFNKIYLFSCSSSLSTEYQKLSRQCEQNEPLPALYYICLRKFRKVHIKILNISLL